MTGPPIIISNLIEEWELWQYMKAYLAGILKQSGPVAKALGWIQKMS